jgi:hypothetical protein
MVGGTESQRRQGGRMEFPMGTAVSYGTRKSSKDDPGEARALHSSEGEFEGWCSLLKRTKHLLETTGV